MTKKISAVAEGQERIFLTQLEVKLKEYEKLVIEKEKEGLLAPNTRATYLLHADNFVKWCYGEFIPGDSNKNMRCK